MNKNSTTRARALLCLCRHPRIRTFSNGVGISVAFHFWLGEGLDVTPLSICRSRGVPTATCYLISGYGGKGGASWGGAAFRFVRLHVCWGFNFQINDAHNQSRFETTQGNGREPSRNNSAVLIRLQPRKFPLFSCESRFCELWIGFPDITHSNRKQWHSAEQSPHPSLTCKKYLKIVKWLSELTRAHKNLGRGEVFDHFQTSRGPS